MKEVKIKGIRCLTEEPRIGAHGKPVIAYIFLHVEIRDLLFHFCTLFYAALVIFR